MQRTQSRRRDRKTALRKSANPSITASNGNAPFFASPIGFPVVLESDSKNARYSQG